MNIYIDIETHPNTRPNISMEDMPVPATYKKPESIQAYREENYDTWIKEAWHKQALNSMEGKIWALGFAIGEAEPIVKIGNEKDMLISFSEAIETCGVASHGIKWVGHNIKGFDLPWLFHKAIQYNCKGLQNAFPKNRWDKQIFDTMEQFNPWNNDKVSLDKICTFLGIPNKLSCDYKGFWELHPAEQGECVRDYCANDVAIVREVYKRLA